MKIETEPSPKLDAQPARVADLTGRYRCSIFGQNKEAEGHVELWDLLSAVYRISSST